jgi:hypothetical protein
LALFAASIARQFLMERKLRVQTGGGAIQSFKGS